MAIRKKTLLMSASIFATAAVVAAVIWWQQKPEARAASLTPPFQANAPRLDLSDNKKESAVAAAQSTKSAPSTAPPATLRQRMKIAKDWYALAQEILPLAKAGSSEAQYVLFKTYRDCNYRYNDKRAPSSENAARESATAYGVSADDAAMWFGRCHRLVTEDVESLGNPWDWLQKATDAGYPLAQVTTAQERLLQDQSKAAVRAGEHPDDVTVSLPPIGGEMTPRELLVLAAQGAEPEVLGEIGDLQYALNPTQPRDVTNIDTAAWMYAGCQRDCSGFGQPATVINCGANDGNCVGVPNWLLKLVNYNWAPVQDKVNQINTALNAKQWDQLPGLMAVGK